MGWPAITLPSGLSKERLPLGIQLVGAPFAERMLFLVARWAECQIEPVPAPDSASAHSGARAT
jgi:Asp-tRNA(Asn)/Glu-tRNA(Gln) amidotransferase A subunit family amidase